MHLIHLERKENNVKLFRKYGELINTIKRTKCYRLYDTIVLYGINYICLTLFNIVTIKENMRLKAKLPMSYFPYCSVKMSMF